MTLISTIANGCIIAGVCSLGWIPLACDHGISRDPWRKWLDLLVIVAPLVLLLAGVVLLAVAQ